MKEKVSIIVPVYNTEKYLKECVDSILRQSYKDLEILLVDDGSQDRSGQICDEYASSDSRIVVIHQKNQGLSVSRNNGIRAATGSYLLFMDSDDYWDDREIVEKLVCKALEHGAELVNYRYKHFIEDKGKYIDCLPDYQEFTIGPTKEETLQKLLERGLFLASACNKMIKTELLKENELFFQEGIIAEDVDWCARLMLACNKVDYCNSDAYIYRQRSGSITHSVQYKNVKQVYDNVLYCLALGEGLTGKMYSVYHTYVAYQYGVFQVTNHLVKDERVRKLRKDMKAYRWLLKYHSNKKVKMLWILNQSLGYAGMNLVMSVYSRLR